MLTLITMAYSAARLRSATNIPLTLPHIFLACFALAAHCMLIAVLRALSHGCYYHLSFTGRLVFSVICASAMHGKQPMAIILPSAALSDLWQMLWQMRPYLQLLSVGVSFGLLSAGQDRGVESVR